MSEFSDNLSVEERALSKLESGVVVAHFSQERAAALNVPLIVDIQHDVSNIDVQGLARALIQRFWNCRVRLDVTAEPVKFFSVSLEGALAQAVLEPRFVAPSDHDDAVDDLVNTPFNILGSVLWRIGSVSSRERATTLVIVFHHVVADGQSMSLLFEEIGSLLSKGQLSGDGPGDHLFQDIDAKRYTRDIEYWKERLRQLINEPGVTSFRRGLIGSKGPSKVVVIALSLDESAQLVTLSGKVRVSQFSVFLHLVMSILQKHGGDAPVTVGVPFDTRNQNAKGIGLFTNVLPVRFERLLDESADTRMRIVMSGVVETLMHCSVPFGDIVAEASLSGRLDKNPIFQTLVNERRLESRSYEAVNLVERIESPTASQYEMTWTLIYESGQPSKIQIIYDCTLFDEPAIRSLAGHLQNLLRNVAGDPSRSVKDIEFLTEAELKRLLVGWNDTDHAVDYSHSIADLISAMAVRNGKAIAVRSGDLEISYEDLVRRSDQAAQVLREAGVGPDKVVGICLDRTCDLVVLILAVWKAGGAYLPLDSSYPIDRLEFMIGDAEAVVVITEESYRHLFATTEPTVICRTEIWSRSASVLTQSLPTLGGAQNLAYVIYTSGSTGEPKGVMIEQRSLLCFFQWSLDTFAPEAFEVVVASTPVTFDISIFEIFSPLLSGGKVLVIKNLFDLEHLEGQNPTLINSVPSVVSAVLRFFPLPKSLKVLVLAGEPLPVELVQRLPENLEIYNCYGPSEDTIFTTWTKVERSDKLVTIGRPIWNTKLFVLDEQRQLAMAGIPGELYIGGLGLARGYLNRPELTAERFIANPFGNGRLYRTGDRVRYRSDGQLEYIGRYDNQVKLRGQRIELGEVESILRSIQGIAEAVARVVYVDGEAHLVAYILPESSHDGDELEIRVSQYLRKKLPRAYIPEKLIYLDSFPMTTSGKIDRKSLPAPSFSASVRGSALAPTSVNEVRLVNLFSEALQRPDVGVDDGFFELGGTSLLALRLAARISDNLHVEVGLRTIFEHPSARELAVELDHLPPSRDWALPISGHDPSGIAQVSSAQRRLWTVDRISPSSSYNVPFGWMIRGDLDLVALDQAIVLIVERHESLRTCFPVVNDEPVQKVQALPSSILEVKSLGHDPETLSDAVGKFVASKFLLERDLPIRAVLFQIEPEKNVLLVCVHHIAFDGWSLDLFCQELANNYNEVLKNAYYRPPGLATQYRDYAAWESGPKFNKLVGQQEAFWLNELSGVPILATIPGSNVRDQTTAAGHVAVRISAEEIVGLKSYAARNNLTLLMIMQSCVALLVARTTGQWDIPLGVASANRPSTDIHNLIGFFVNTIVVRLLPTPEMTLEEMFSHVRETSLRAYANGQVSFDRVVDLLNPVRRPGVNPLFQIMVAVDDMSIRPLILGESSANRYPVYSADAKLDLSINLESGASDAPALRIEYLSSLYDDSFVAKLGGHLRTLLQSMTSGAPCKLKDIESFPAEELRQLLDSWSKNDQKLGSSRPTHELSSLGELQLLNLFSEVLQKRDVGVQDSFFALGGTSLLALRLATRIGDLFHVEVGLDSIFERPSARELAVELDHLPPSRDWALPISRHDHSGIAQVSSAQRRLWTVDHISRSSSYNVPFAWVVGGDLDLVALDKAIALIVERHESLRTRFPVVNDEPVQEVLGSPNSILEVRTLGDDPEKLRNAVGEFVAHRLVLERDLPIRAVVFQIEPEKNVLLFCVHHIAFDGWSLDLFCQELANNYSEVRKNASYRPEALATQYRDYTAWESGPNFNKLVGQQEAFWLSELSGMPTLVTIPGSNVRDHRTAAGHVVVQISAMEIAGLKSYAAKNNLTLLMIVQGCVALLVAKTTGQWDIPLGVASANRPSTDTHNLIGFFVNTIVVRLRPTAEMTLPEIFAHVRETSLRAYAHGQVSFDRVVRLINPKRLPDVNPLFQIIIAVDNMAVRPFSLGENSANRYPVYSTDAKLDLSINLEWGESDAPVLRIEYLASLYDESLVQGLALNLRGILREISTDTASKHAAIGAMFSGLQS